MNSTVLFSGLLFFLSATVSNPGSFNYSNETLKIEYEKENGKLNGLYTSFYNNGNKKSQGLFKNNLRSGLWVIWNEEGGLVTKREYYSNGEFKVLIPQVENQSMKPLFRNSDNYFEYKPIIEDNIIWAKRIWRTIDRANNDDFFENKKLAKSLTKGILGEQIHIYSPTDDEMKTGITQKSEEIINQLNENQIISFAIKEDVYFDKTTGTNETRIIALAPMVKDINSKKLVCWFYYPEIRKTLATVSINESNHNSKIQTLEDLFFFRNFAGAITKESNSENAFLPSDVTSTEFVK